VLLEVGRVVRAHGLRGDVVVELITDRTERVAPGSRLHTDDRLVTVLSSQPYQGRYLVAFDGVNDRAGADALVGASLRADPVDDPDAVWVHDLIGSVVRDIDGTERGRVVSVLANPAHDQLVLDSGALVPSVFVVSCAAGVTVIDPPDGLFE
jgi:16S rRNA processing protein RimM